MASSELRIVMLGKTGVGKSATGNTILGNKEFESKARSKSVTVKCSKQSATVAEYNFAVVDTPGLFDTTHSEEVIVKETTKCVTMLAPGPHAFLIIVSVLRFTAEEQQTIVKIQEIFGSGIGKYAVVVFTRSDDLEADGQTIDDFVRNASPELKNLIEQCGGRYHAINNRARDSKQVIGLLKKVDDLAKTNSTYYSSALFDLAAKVKEQEEHIEAEKKKSSKLESHLPDLMKKRDEDIKRLEDEIRQLRQNQGSKCTIS